LATEDTERKFLKRIYKICGLGVLCGKKFDNSTLTLENRIIF